jgi:outer membrane protein assembly factor BamE
MKKLLVTAALALGLTSCALLPVHKMDIEQGNVLTPNMVSQIHTGMSQDQVKEILGTPVLLNTFSDNRVDYVYTYKPGYGKMQEQYITLIFQNGRLKTINGNMYSAYINKK